MSDIYEKQINGVNVIIEKVKTDIKGLSFKPQMTDIDNDLDWAPFTKKATSNNPTPNNLKLMGDISKKYMRAGIDGEKYDVKKYFEGEADFGMAIAFKK